MVKLFLTAIVIASVSPGQAFAQKIKPSETFLVQGALLAMNSQKINDGDKVLALSLKELQREADAALTRGPYSVMNKSKVPPSGDKHDYMSVGPYWWPDSTKAGGLPYIRRDGVVNPERHTIKDSDDLKLLAHEVKLLGLAYYFTTEEKYAQHAHFLLRTWFLNKDTKMNPNLNYGQAIPGITEGRGIGLIDTKCLADVVDGIQLIKNSGSWTKTDHHAMQKWFSEFLNWMLTSPIGKDEAGEHNNHGVYYDLQSVSIALFIGNKELAKKIIQEQTIPRIESQILEDGSQPYELARTKSWSYAAMNLKGFFGLARLGEHVGVDLWNYQTREGKSIKKAFGWMLPYASGKKEWTHEQIEPIDWNEFLPLLTMAAPHYPDPVVQQLISQLRKDDDQILKLTNSVFY